MQVRQQRVVDDVGGHKQEPSTQLLRHERLYRAVLRMQTSVVNAACRSLAQHC